MFTNFIEFNFKTQEQNVFQCQVLLHHSTYGRFSKNVLENKLIVQLFYSFLPHYIISTNCGSVKQSNRNN